MMSAPRAILKYGFDSELSCKVSGQEGGGPRLGKHGCPAAPLPSFSPPPSSSPGTTLLLLAAFPEAVPYLTAPFGAATRPDGT